MSAPKKTIQHDIDRQACSILEHVIAYCAKVKHEAPDYGIDFTFEYFDDFNGKSAEISGLDFCVQCKGCSTPPHRTDYLSYPLETEKISYYLDKKRRPVFLVVVDTLNQVAYWQFMQEYAKTTLKTQSWRQQKTVSVRIPLSQRLDVHQHFKLAVIAADKYIRDLWPGSIPSAIEAEKQRIEKADPRVTVDISATRKGVHVTLNPKSPISSTIQIDGPAANVKKAFRDAIDRGLPVVAKKYGIKVSVVGLPGHPSETDVAEFITNKSLLASARLSSLDHSGNLKGSVELEGTIESGNRESRFDASLSSKIIRLRAHWNNGGKLPVKFKVNYQFNLKPWFKHPIWRLRDFDRLATAFGGMSSTDILQIELFCEGNLLSSSRQQVAENETLLVLPGFIHWIKKARNIASQLATDISIPGPLTKRGCAEIEYCEKYVNCEDVPVTVNNLKMSTLSTEDDVDKMKLQFAGVQRDVRFAIPAFELIVMGKKVNGGPAQLHWDEARVELKCVARSRQHSGQLLAEWLLIPVTQSYARRLLKAESIGELRVAARADAS